MDDDDWFSLAELTTRLGGLVWAEEQLGELLAGWSKIDASAPVAIAFASAGGHHRWHGEVIRACLPTSPQLNADDAVRAPTPGWAQSIETLRNLNDPDATVARLRALTKVIDPWLHREIAVLLDLSRPVSDASMQRWLRFTTLDHGDDGDLIHQLLAARSAEPTRFEDHATLATLDLS